ncbi:MAG: hypothetical protein PHY23_00005 [Oscillospiraceae bacterium]|nr:hypothetical protein [Oscillospiraceae bacterium]
MSDEKRMAENYEITQAIRIGGREVVFGVDEKAERPYFCAFYGKQFLFGFIKERYEECVTGDDYVEIVELFSQRIKEQCDKVRAEWAQTEVPRKRITAEMCSPNDYAQSIEGKIVAVKLSTLHPEYQSAEHQLIYITGGSGARANSRGTACFCKNLYTGEDTRWERYDIQGEIKTAHLPDWAKERLAVIQAEQAQKSKKPAERGAR